MSWTRRAFLLGTGGVLGAATTRVLTTPSMAGAGVILPGDGAGTLNDASQLSQTPIANHAVLRNDGGPVLTGQLRQELRTAASEGRPVCIGAARHSMGGHAIPREGRAITLDGPWTGLAEDRSTMRVLAGTRWRDVIATLDQDGCSPKVMQSNNDFGVAATFSVNAHGWATAHGPMGSTVRSMSMMLADGQEIEASRGESPDLFAAAMGGYGLIGLITALTVDVVPNRLLQPTFRRMAATDFAPAFMEAVKAAPMAYGRLNVDREGFFEDALLVTYAPTEGEVPRAEGSGFLSRAARPIFRAQVGSEWTKRGRWWTETTLQPSLVGPATRNSLLNEPVLTLDDRNPMRTDILHEYFVAPDRFGDFLDAARAIIPKSYQELLNITLRWVERDPESLLSYAPDGPRIASVLLFSQEMTERAEIDMMRMTRDMIDAVLAHGGSYYLPYRPHATLDQFRRAYPRWEEFVALKRRVDPRLTLRNGFWDNYLAKA